MERLDTPSRFDEPASEPIEELGVRGGLAAGAKVVARRHEPTAKMLLPDPVDHDARRERVLFTGDPAGEFDPAAAAGSDERTGMFSILPVLRTDGGRAEKAGDVTRGDRPELKTIPAKVDAEVAGEGFFRGHDHDRVATVARWHQILPPHRGVADLVLERLGAAKDPRQGVVVGRANRVKLVVVAAGTGEREAEEGPAGDIDLVVDDVEPRLLLVGLGERLRADHQEACGNRPCGIGGGVAAGGEEIAGELFDEEAVVGEIAVAGVDDPVAVAPGLRHYGVGIVGRGLGEANDVEPVAGLLLAVMGRGEEPVDDLAPSIGPGVGEEGGGLLRRRREPGEVEGHPPQERGPIGLGQRWHSQGLDLRREEAIDRRRGGLTAGRRGGRIDEPLVGPVGPFGGAVGGAGSTVGAAEIEGVFLTEPDFEADAAGIVEGGRKHERLAYIPLDRSAPRHGFSEEGADVGAVAEVGDAIAPFELAGRGTDFAAVDEQSRGRADRARLLDGDDERRSAEGCLE